VIRVSQNACRIRLARDEIWIQRFTDGGKDDIAEIVSDLVIARDHLRSSRSLTSLH
jgi:hypothetical protein